MPRIVSKWELTPEALGRLMARLDADPTVAGEKYEHLRRALVRFFTWRGTAEPEMCADETLDRLARRLEAGATIDDVPTFAHGVARLVRLERARQAAAIRLSFDVSAVARLAAPEPAVVDELSQHVEACLNALPTEDRLLVLRYYTGERRDLITGRSRLARQLGISDNALRHRAQRLRGQLRQCAHRRQHAFEDSDSTRQARR